MITGDDILIEYVSRLVRNMGNAQNDMLLTYQHDRVEKFISHYVWHMPDLQNEGADNLNDNQVIKERLSNRLSEMTDRRRRLIKYMFKKESKNE